MATMITLFSGTALLESGLVAPALFGTAWLGTPRAAIANQDGLLTIESDTQSADNITGVVTAIGNVRIIYPARGMQATSRQVQYFSKEGRLVLSGDVDIVQEDGKALQAERVVYLLDEERVVAIPKPGGQVFTRMRIQPDQPDQNPFTP
ncbi:MAG: LptA/OstA family protein [Prochlorococcus sp.]